jgi:hypothetical protein
MTSYSVILQRFNDEWNNGATFATNPTTVYSTDLQGNVGDRIKLTQTIEISVTVNPNQIQTIQYNATADATYGEFVGTGINFLTEGMYVGAVLDIDWGGGAVVSATVGLITGTSSNTLRVTKANLTAAGIVDGDIRTDFRMRLTSVPDTLIYKYGINPNGFTGISYSSWFDSNIQGYYIANLTGSLQTMTRIGLGIKSWDLSTVQAKYDATVATYKFQYTVEHEFKIPFYIASQYENLNDGTSPDKFLGTASVTYDNGWFFGGSVLGEYIKAEIKGGLGSVGYFKENFNGYANNYEIQDVVITNSDNSGVLEGTVANTVTFSVKNNLTNWTAGTSKLILRHAKLPTSTEYSNKPVVFDTIWIYDQAVQVEGAGAVAGTAVITTYTVTINADPTLLDVSVVITYDAGEQSLISDTSDYLLFVTAGSTATNDRVSLPVDLNKFSKNLDVTGLITQVDVEFFEPFEFNGGSRRLASWTGWDGDLGGVKATVTKNATTVCAIKSAKFKIISTDGTETLELLSINVPIGKINTVDVGGQSYQILNVDVQGGFTLPTGEQLNRITGDATVPASPGASQLFVFELGFQTPWREWVFNNSVPNSLYDAAEPQNNQNFKTSNYSNVDSFEVFPIWEFVLLTDGGVETTYRKLTYESNVSDFDTNGATFTAVTVYYDEDNNVTSNVYVDKNVRIEISFTHALGIITLANIEGYIWIERDGSTQAPWFLHTSKDFTSPLNPLTPSDTLASGNTQFVEVVSSNNLIKLICFTNRDNLQDGVSYNIYGRIKNETLA